MNEQKIATNIVKIFKMVGYSVLLLVLVSILLAITLLIFSIIISPDIRGTLFNTIEGIILETVNY